MTIRYVECTDGDFLICSDCAQHIANDESGCCHNPEHETYTGPFADVPCEVQTRMRRVWRRKGIVDITLNYVDEGDEEFSTFSTRTCESCGDPHDGERIRATATVRHIETVQRSFTRHGHTVTLTQYDRGPMSPFYMSARSSDHRLMGQYGGSYLGAGRYLALAQFVANIPAPIGV